MNKLSEKDYLKTPDLCLCSTLCCYGYQVEAIDRQNRNKSIFLIKRDEDLDNVIQQYFTHQLKVEPQAFFNFLKELKTRLYNV